MRSSRAAKKRNHKLYARYLLWTFLVFIPVAALLSSWALHAAFSKPETLSHAMVLSPEVKAETTFKYNFDISSKEFYRVELKRFEKYEDAEAMIANLKSKKLNGFIVKEQGYLTAFGVFPDKSQADTAVEYLTRKKLQSKINIVSVKGLNILYDNMDKDLIDLTNAVDIAIIKIINDKSALSLESLYGKKLIKATDLVSIIENEQKLSKYLNYLRDSKTSENNAFVKENLESLISELVVDKLQSDVNYDYYGLQNSLLNQTEAIRKFYEKHKI